MDIRAYNRDAWNRYVEEDNQWTRPVGPEVISSARKGKWEIYLTPIRPVPKDWFPPLQGADVLCLASGGGQQGPVLAALGANVTVFDNSPSQLAQDRHVAQREGLHLRTEEGDMADLSRFADESFDLVVHPVSNVFVKHIAPVWQETFRVLRLNGSLLAGFTNPILYIFDWELMDEQGILDVRYPLPYSDLDSLSEEALQRQIEKGWALEFSHSLEDQIGGQLEAGFVLTGFYEDQWNEDVIVNDYFPSFMASRALKVAPGLAVG